MCYCKNSKNLDYPKIQTVWFYHAVMCSVDREGMANNVAV